MSARSPDFGAYLSGRGAIWAEPVLFRDYLWAEDPGDCYTSCAYCRPLERARTRSATLVALARMANTAARSRDRPDRASPRKAEKSKDFPARGPGEPASSEESSFTCSALELITKSKAVVSAPRRLPVTFSGFATVGDNGESHAPNFRPSP